MDLTVKPFALGKRDDAPEENLHAYDVCVVDDGMERLLARFYPLLVGEIDGRKMREQERYTERRAVEYGAWLKERE